MLRLRRLSLPIQLILIIATVLLFGNYFSKEVVRFFYTASVILKEVVGFLLPFIIFFFVLSGIISLKKNAPVILAILIFAIFISNGFVALFVYAVSKFTITSIAASLSLEKVDLANSIIPLLTFQLPSFVKSEIALMSAIICGIFLSFLYLPKLEFIVYKARGHLNGFLQNIFIPILPVYVFGFLLKIKYEGVFSALIYRYGSAFALIVVLQIFYLTLMYFVANKASLKKTFLSIKRALPSYITAFSTMSSTVTIPVTMRCAIKNIKNRTLAEMAVPIMANVHLVGDSISTPILAIVTMQFFMGIHPAFITYLIFIFYFCFSMFAVSGIPGGGIIVMIPILKSYLGFTPEMISIMMTLYLLLDSFGTAANVMGDGALIIFINRILKKFKLIPEN